MKTIVCDVDGVVAEFGHAYYKLMHDYVNSKIVPLYTSQVPTWNYAYDSLNDGEKERMNKIFYNKTDFFDNLEETQYGIVAKIQAKRRPSDIWYWCTSRQSVAGSRPINEITNQWLKTHGFSCPNVVVSSAKGVFCKAVKADYFIDDKWENVLNVIHNSPKTKIFYLPHLYGKKNIVAAKKYGIVVLNKVEDILETEIF